MSGAELTPVFPGSVKPARPGVYATHKPMRGWFALWTGTKWCSQRKVAIHAAQASRFSVAAFQNKAWQGLASEPTA